MSDRDDKIRDRAYQLWQQDGEPHGQDQDHWHRAQSELTDAPIPADDATSDAEAAPVGDGAQIGDGADAPGKPAARAAKRRAPRNAAVPAAEDASGSGSEDIAATAAPDDKPRRGPGRPRKA